MQASDQLTDEIRSEFPGFSIKPKAGHALSRAIDLGLRVVTLGGQSRYLSEYHTVIGDTLWVPAAWASTPDVDRVILLRHERVHLRQRRRYGSLLMTVLYLFFPFFPIGLAYGRARIEWEAYEETLRATAELRGLGAARDGELRRRIVGRFVGPEYGWMWPFRRQVETWYDRALALIEREGHAGWEPSESPRRASA